MSNNERQRKYMEKVLASPTKHAAYLAKEKDRNNKRKEVKALQTQTMSERDKRNQKRKWKLAQRTYRRKCKLIDVKTC